MLERVTTPVRHVGYAAMRRETLPGLVREASSTVVTMALYPFGLADHGLAELKKRITHEPPGPIRTPVLLVHGFGANKSNWMIVRRALRDAGFAHVDALNYNPFRHDIPELGARCVDRARAVMDATGSDRIHLVGHSLGGIVVRQAVQIGGLAEAASCITVASPHQGVPAARFAPRGTAQQLGPMSDVLRQLRASARPMDTAFVAYYSNLDMLVQGQRAKILEPALRAENILIKDEGHLSILLSRRLTQSLVEHLTAIEGVAGYQRAA